MIANGPKTFVTAIVRSGGYTLECNVVEMDQAEWSGPVYIRQHEQKSLLNRTLPLWNAEIVMPELHATK